MNRKTLSIALISLGVLALLYLMVSRRTGSESAAASPVSIDAELVQEPIPEVPADAAGD